MWKIREGNNKNTEGTKFFFEVRLPYEQQEENDTVNEQNCYHI